MRKEIVVLGAVVLIVGIIAYIYETSIELFGQRIPVSSPYRELGTGLILLGLVIIVVGAIVKGREKLTAPSPTTSLMEQEKAQAYRRE